MAGESGLGIAYEMGRVILP